jgi:hypothetical protein
MKRFLILLCAAFFFNQIFPQNTISQAQALFIHNFASLSEWPDSYKNGPFIIGVMGEGEIMDQLTAYSKDRNVNNRQIKVVSFNSPEEISTCHILFIPFSKTRLIPAIEDHLQNSSTLIITEKYGALNAGSAINFVIIEQKMKFEISAENANRYGIRFSDTLEDMAIAVR